MVDVFPRRNLPPLAEQWGREVESRVTSLELGTETIAQGLSGQNRNTASSLSVIAQQIEELRLTQATIPVSSSKANAVTGFDVPSTYPSWTETSRVDIPNPAGRNQLSLFCVGTLGLYENVSPSTAFAQSAIRVYDLETGAFIRDSGDQPTSKTVYSSVTFHSGTPIYAATFTTPPGGVYVVLEITSTLPGNFPTDVRNYSRLIAQTSFL